MTRIVATELETIYFRWAKGVLSLKIKGNEIEIKGKGCYLQFTPEEVLQFTHKLRNIVKKYIDSFEQPNPLGYKVDTDLPLKDEENNGQEKS